jgi:transposase
MSHEHKPDPEVQAKASRRRFSAAYKQRIVAEAEQCAHGELGTLLRREGLYYAQITAWRRAAAEGHLTDKPRGPKAHPDAQQVKHLQQENERLQRRLVQAEAIIDAQKKLADLLAQARQAQQQETD